MRNIKDFVTIVSLLFCSAVIAKSNDVSLTSEEQSVLKKLMVETKVNLLLASEIEGSATEYKSDGDPLTLELVMLEKGVGADRVSDDGEVIFMHEKTKDKVQQQLITTAFYLRTKKYMAENAK
jgi:hypothetical protein